MIICRFPCFGRLRFLVPLPHSDSPRRRHQQDTDHSSASASDASTSMSRRWSNWGKSIDLTNHHGSNFAPLVFLQLSDHYSPHAMVFYRPMSGQSSSTSRCLDQTSSRSSRCLSLRQSERVGKGFRLVLHYVLGKWWILWKWWILGKWWILVFILFFVLIFYFIDLYILFYFLDDVKIWWCITSYKHIV